MKKQIKKIILLFSNEHMKAMLFSFMIIVMSAKYIKSIIVQILLGIIACSIVLKSVLNIEDNEK